MTKMGPPRRGHDRTCAICGAAFYAHNRSQRKYCSRACYYKTREIGQFKTCSKCKEYKPIAEFPRHRENKYQGYCQPCGLAVNAAWRSKNRPPKSGVVRFNLPKKTPEERKAAKLSFQRSYRNKNRDKVRLWNRLGMHRRKAAGQMPDKWFFSRMMCEQDARCPYCSALLPMKFEIDHKIPISRGGTNNPENLHLVCPTCNMRKNNKTHEEFIQRLKEEQRRFC